MTTRCACSIQGVARAPGPPHYRDKMHLVRMYRYSSDERWLVVARQGRLFPSTSDPDAPPIELPGHRHDVIAFRITTDAHWLVSIDRPVTEPAGYVPEPPCSILGPVVARPRRWRATPPTWTSGSTASR